MQRDRLLAFLVGPHAGSFLVCTLLDTNLCSMVLAVAMYSLLKFRLSYSLLWYVFFFFFFFFFFFVCVWQPQHDVFAGYRSGGELPSVGAGQPGMAFHLTGQYFRDAADTHW